MIVTPKDSVFVEESKPPSASVLLKLKSDLSQEKIDAVVHLVASSLEGMKPELVTVVDTKGRVLSKQTSEDEKLGDATTTQFKYKNAYELNLAKANPNHAGTDRRHRQSDRARNGGYGF